MKNKTRYLRKVLEEFRKELKPDATVTWLELFLAVADAGDGGITTLEIYDYLYLKQANGSRIIKVLSSTFNPKTKETEGYGLLRTELDAVHRHRYRLFLTDKGKELLNKITE